ncbi:MAG: type VII secretion system-associated protein [Actinomycetota bacterium]|nr:type VII secretion system-associated protein [Actinomycetota bacterium]
MEQPEITRDMRAGARAHPNSWLYVIDPMFGPDEDVPPWGVVGAYPVDENGEIVDGFRANAEYRPSPRALRMPVPSNPLEQVMQLIHTRHLEQAELLPALVDSTLLVYSESPEDRGVTGFANHDGTVMVPACTSASHVPASWPGWRDVAGRDLARLLYGYPLAVNPSGPVTAVVPAAHLTNAAGG